MFYVFSFDFYFHKGDIDVLEPGYGLSIERSVSLLQRVLSLADIMVIASNVSLHDLEHEKSMTSGTMLRQCLRIGKSCRQGCAQVH